MIHIYIHYYNSVFDLYSKKNARTKKSTFLSKPRNNVALALILKQSKEPYQGRSAMSFSI